MSTTRPATQLVQALCSGTFLPTPVCSHAQAQPLLIKQSCSAFCLVQDHNFTILLQANVLTPVPRVSSAIW